MTPKAWKPGFAAGLMLSFAVHLPAAAFAQDGIERVISFARNPLLCTVSFFEKKNEENYSQ